MTEDFILGSLEELTQTIPEGVSLFDIVYDLNTSSWNPWTCCYLYAQEDLLREKSRHLDTVFITTDLIRNSFIKKNLLRI
jgi:hypothetical protein